MIIEVKKSKIHGRGVFAVQDIPANTPLDDESQVQIVIIGISFPGFNHSCQPNVDNKSLRFPTTRAVRAGEELTVYYGSHMVGHCNCPHCQKEK